MKRLFATIGAVVEALTLHSAIADDADRIVITPVLTTSVTSSGQLISLPAGKVTVSVVVYEIKRRAMLPEHKHLYPRYGYVMNGQVRITNTGTGHAEIYRAGDFIIEALGQWHYAENIGEDVVKLLVIDQTDGTSDNVILRK
jgi:quercetin dioxygenase-like cupin family protein